MILRNVQYFKDSYVQSPKYWISKKSQQLRVVKGLKVIISIIISLPKTLIQNGPT